MLWRAVPRWSTQFTLSCSEYSTLNWFTCLFLYELILMLNEEPTVCCSFFSQIIITLHANQNEMYFTLHFFFASFVYNFSVHTIRFEEKDSIPHTNKWARTHTHVRIHTFVFFVFLFFASSFYADWCGYSWATKGKCGKNRATFVQWLRFDISERSRAHLPSFAHRY